MRTGLVVGAGLIDWLLHPPKTQVVMHLPPKYRSRHRRRGPLDIFHVYGDVRRVAALIEPCLSDCGPTFAEVRTVRSRRLVGLIVPRHVVILRGYRYPL